MEIDNKIKTFRQKLSEILVKWSMPTRQVAILEIVRLHKASLEEVRREEREKAKKEERERIRQWAKENNQCGDLVSTYDLMMFLKRLKAKELLKGGVE